MTPRLNDRIEHNNTCYSCVHLGYKWILSRNDTENSEEGTCTSNKGPFIDKVIAAYLDECIALFNSELDYHTNSVKIVYPDPFNQLY